MNEHCVCAFLEGNLVSFCGAIAMIKNVVDVRVDAEKGVKGDVCGLVCQGRAAQSHWCVFLEPREDGFVLERY